MLDYSERDCIEEMRLDLGDCAYNMTDEQVVKHWQWKQEFISLEEVDPFE